MLHVIAHHFFTSLPVLCPKEYKGFLFADSSASNSLLYEALSAHIKIKTCVNFLLSIYLVLIWFLNLEKDPS